MNPEMVGSQFVNVWRAERRSHDEDLDNPKDVGIHWTTSPKVVDRFTEIYHKPHERMVVWSGQVAQHHLMPEDHPTMTAGLGEGGIWSSEREKRIRPGGQVKITGRRAFTADEVEDTVPDIDDGYILRHMPETPMDRTVPARKPGREDFHEDDARTWG